MAAEIPDCIGVEGAIAGAHLLSRPAEEFGNDVILETIWAMKATEHMEVYFNLLCSLDPKLLKLTPHDDDIYTEFKREFPDFALDVLCEENLKSDESKQKWRPFCEKFANIVEDYNFGTLVRINCSDEYCEENSIFVLRIQFYAIEIARNREGLNDGIRSKFKPITRNQRIPCNYCLLTVFKREVQVIFHRICMKYGISEVSTKPFIRREDGSEEKGDFSMLFNSPLMVKLVPFLKQMMGGYHGLMNQLLTLMDSDSFNLAPSHRLDRHDISEEMSMNLESFQLSKCKLISEKCIRFSLNRVNAFSSVLSETSVMKEEYGRSNCGEGQVIVISVYHTKDDSIEHPAVVRSDMIANHVAALLLATGFKVYLHCNSPSSLYMPELLSQNLQLIKCSNCYDIDRWCNILEKRSKESKWLMDDNICHVLCQNASAQTKTGISYLDIKEEIVLDSKRYLDECIESQNAKKYLKKVNCIYVRKNGFTKILKRVAELEHILCDHLDSVPLGIVYVCSEKQEYRMQCSGLLLEMLSEKHLTRQLYITHKVGNEDQEEMNMTNIYRRRKGEMKVALVHKYGSEVLGTIRLCIFLSQLSIELASSCLYFSCGELEFCERKSLLLSIFDHLYKCKYGTFFRKQDDESWLRCINTLTDTAIKFDFLSYTSSPVKLMSYEADKNREEKKKGTFVQYNCARLAMLFKRHQEMVNEGKYDPLPAIEEIDFGLLKLEEEWNLLFNYVMKFPQMIQSMAENFSNSSSLRVQCPSREICRFLMALSQDLSLYYNRKRILGEAVPHLQKIMAARLLLLQAVHQVMKNALALLGVEALEQM